jgi:hypothetical protein
MYAIVLSLLRETDLRVLALSSSAQRHPLLTAQLHAGSGRISARLEDAAGMPDDLPAMGCRRFATAPAFLATSRSE